MATLHEVRHMILAALRARGIPAAENSDGIEVATHHLLGAAHAALTAAHEEGDLGDAVLKIARRFGHHFDVVFANPNNPVGKGWITVSRPRGPTPQPPPIPWRKLAELPAELGAQAAQGSTIRAVPGIYIGRPIPAGLSVIQAIQHLRQKCEDRLWFWVHAADGTTILVNGDGWVYGGRPQMKVGRKPFAIRAKTSDQKDERAGDDTKRLESEGTGQ